MQTKMRKLGMGSTGLTVLAVFASSVAHGAPNCGVGLECAETGGWIIQSSESAPLDVAAALAVERATEWVVSAADARLAAAVQAVADVRLPLPWEPSLTCDARWAAWHGHVVVCTVVAGAPGR